MLLVAGIRELDNAPNKEQEVAADAMNAICSCTEPNTLDDGQKVDELQIYVSDVSFWKTCMLRMFVTTQIINRNSIECINPS